MRSNGADAFGHRVLSAHVGPGDIVAQEARVVIMKVAAAGHRSAVLQVPGHKEGLKVKDEIPFVSHQRLTPISLQ